MPPPVCREVCAITYRLVATQMDSFIPLRPGLGQMLRGDLDADGLRCVCTSLEEEGATMTIDIGVDPRRHTPCARRIASFGSVRQRHGLLLGYENRSIPYDMILEESVMNAVPILVFALAVSLLLCGRRRRRHDESPPSIKSDTPV